MDPLSGFGTFLGSQLAFVSPVLAVGGVVALARSRGLVAWAAGPMLAIFAAQSLFSPFKAHWTAGAWAVLLIPLPPRADVTNELYGWDVVAERIPDGSLVAAHMYQNASQLAFALRGRDRALGEALFVAHDRYFLDAAEHADRLGFAACEVREEVPVSRGDRVVRTFTLWACRP